MRQRGAPLADETRRQLFSKLPALALLSTITTSSPNRANAIGPVKIGLTPTSYTALPCPKNRPIPGQKAMAGMRGLCVTVEASLDEAPPKDLNKVGVYGFVTDGETGDSVLANNPDLSTDAGQFAMIESITTDDRKVRTVPPSPHWLFGLISRIRCAVFVMPCVILEISSTLTLPLAVC
jgi:hypothetical protein